MNYHNEIDSRLGHIFREVRGVAFDFDGVFTDNKVLVSEDGKESIRCWRGDGLGLERLRQIGLPFLIISTESNLVVSARARKLNIFCLQNVSDKATALQDYCKKSGLEPHQMAFVGNDINDISAFRIVGLPIATADAHPEIFQHVLFRTKHNGGMGAVREVCDLLFFAQCENKIASVCQ